MSEAFEKAKLEISGSFYPSEGKVRAFTRGWNAAIEAYHNGMMQRYVDGGCSLEDEELAIHEEADTLTQED